MQITVYKNFSKRINSTKVPASGGTTLSVVIKDYSNIETPSFTLTVSNIDQNSGFLDINYVEAFGRKYFATCNVETSTSFSIDCTLDHLATFKSEIQGYTGLVEYTSASSNLLITDPRNKPTMENLKTKTDFAFGSNPFQTYPGTYILSVISNIQNGVAGPNKYFAIDSYGLSQFSNHLFANNIWEDIVKRFNAVSESIVSCIWLPIAYDQISGSAVSDIYVGDLAISLGDAAGKVVTSRILSLSTGNTTLQYPTWTGVGSVYRKYVGKAPYLTAELYLPFIGWVPMSDDITAYNDSMSIYATIDVLTGDIVYEVLVGGQTIASFNGCCATKVPVSSASYDGMGITSGALTVVGGVAAAAIAIGTGGTGAAVMAGAGAAVAGAANAIKSTELHTQINGTNSSAIGAYIGTNPRLLMIASKPIETDLLAYQTEQGMPYFKTATLSSLSGYIQCADASVSIPGNGSEQSVVNGYLNSGFYLE